MGHGARGELLENLPPTSRFGGRAPDTYGELDIRHEDTVAITDSGSENLGPRWSGTPEEPAVV